MVNQKSKKYSKPSISTYGKIEEITRAAGGKLKVRGDGASENGDLS